MEYSDGDDVFENETTCCCIPKLAIIKFQQLLLEMENILHNCCNTRYHQVETTGIINLAHRCDEVRGDFRNRLCEVYENHECDCDLRNVHPQLYVHTVSKER
jgi:hypothetical protein